MCGGAENNTSPRPEAQAPAPAQVYTPPSLDSVYQMFRDSGTVPYSYYGVNSPTRDGELDLVKKSYPGAFSQSTAPASVPASTRQPSGVDPLIARLMKMGPIGAIMGGLAMAGKARNQGR